MKLLLSAMILFAYAQAFSQVGIGTTTPQEALHVSGVNSQLRVDGLGSANPLNNGAETPLAVDANGKFVLSSSVPQMQFVAMGKILANGNSKKISGATISRLSEGNYEVVFLKGQPDEDYIVSLTLSGGSSDTTSVIRLYDQTVSSFKINISSREVSQFTFFGTTYVTSVDNSDSDLPFMFSVTSIN